LFSGLVAISVIWLEESLPGSNAVRRIVWVVLVCCGLLGASAFSAEWRMIGPDGGNVRSLAYDPSNPDRILLGTSAGQIFASQDGGGSWNLFAHFRLADDYVFDHIVFDPTNPATIYLAGWGLFNDNEGGVFRSDDGGKSWKELPATHGKSIRALAMAASDHNVLVIGALDGVFRSQDGGATWQRMTPENPEILENHASMKNFVSVAIDPLNPEVVYAGTRHLAWKTSDGGKSWHNIKDGMLDDSDVFSIIVDPRNPSRVYASACSGIYKSDNGADLFHRVQGLPHSAIRTRVLKQDPKRSSIVYAGTTGGLWKTIDGGSKWSLVTSSDVIVNDIEIDPRNPERVLVATDLRGVLASNDGFAHYTASNRGFAHRSVGDMLVDHQDASRLYVGIVNDREMGGVFVSEDSGKSWKQSSRGLQGRDVLSLQQAGNGVLFAGTNHGIYRLSSLSGTWEPASMIFAPVPEWQTPAPVAKPPAKSSRSAAQKKAMAAKAKAPVEHVIAAADAPRVRSIQISKDAWFAATNQGLFISVDGGKKWYGQPVQGQSDFRNVNSYDDGTVALVTHKEAYLSRDWGKTWAQLILPDYVGGVHSLTMMPDSSLWLGAREGALHSGDGGKTWQYVKGGLPMSDVLAVEYDMRGQRLLATALNQHQVFESTDSGMTWRRTESADVPLRMVLNYRGNLLAASAHNGVLLKATDATGSSASASVTWTPKSSN
jgi:photosystem II stability/assembly factor-like uncharacterized protein